MSELTGLTENEAAELAYGLLWHMRLIDRHTFDGRLASDARIAIGNAIGADRKRAGVKRAQDFMAAHSIQTLGQPANSSEETTQEAKNGAAEKAKNVTQVLRKHGLAQHEVCTWPGCDCDEKTCAPVTTLPRPTVSELEAILARDDLEIQIKPDGSIEAIEKPKVKSLDEILDGVAEKRRTADY